MIRRTILGTGFVVSTCVLLATPAVWAQQASGIAGVVRDSTGALLPGVTVEAASPALIEKVRTAVSDGQGRYSLVELVSGTYSVTFALTGFKTVRREGILLTSGFTASVDVELQVGSLEETLTVTGDSPLVDTQNVRAQIAVSDEVLKALPTGTESVAAVFVRLVPGFVGHTLARSDVGGSAGVFWSDLVTGSKFHGKVDPTYKSNLDGMRINGFGSGGGNRGVGLHHQHDYHRRSRLGDVRRLGGEHLQRRGDERDSQVGRQHVHVPGLRPVHRWKPAEQ
jgi:carboxypeptidase family protein